MSKSAPNLTHQEKQLIYELRKYGDMSLDEVAKALCITVQTVTRYDDEPTIPEGLTEDFINSTYIGERVALREKYASLEVVLK